MNHNHPITRGATSVPASGRHFRISVWRSDQEFDPFEVVVTATNETEAWQGFRRWWAREYGVADDLGETIEETFDWDWCGINFSNAGVEQVRRVRTTCRECRGCGQVDAWESVPDDPDPVDDHAPTAEELEETAIMSAFLSGEI